MFQNLNPPASAGAPYAFETAPGRLPKVVVPEDYRITIIPDIKAMTLAGTESVRLDFRKASATIQFNSLNEKLEEVTLDGKPVKEVVSDDQAQLTAVTLAEPASAGRHTLRFAYTGQMETKPQDLFAQPFVGAGGTKEVLLTKNGQTAHAGRWDEALSVNADASGFYRVRYDEATLETDSKAFGTLPDGDRIALLDDQWALVESGDQKLPSYLVLASSMGSDLDERAWSQITDGLGNIEYDERGTPGHEAFTCYARSIIKPLADRLGWDAKPGETPGMEKLRRTVLGDLGDWGDSEVIAEAKKRLAGFVNVRGAIRPHDQEMILGVVALNADEATFMQLHEIARSAHDETELRRLYKSLMSVRDPKLADEAVQIALSDEIPAQAASLRLQMIRTLATGNHASLGWKTFTEHSEALLKPYSNIAPLIIAQSAPEWFWNAAPLDQLEAWIKAHVPGEMAPNIARGMDEARFQRALKTLLVSAADSFLQANAGNKNEGSNASGLASFNNGLNGR